MNIEKNNDTKDLPYIPLSEFKARVRELGKTNLVVREVFCTQLDKTGTIDPDCCSHLLQQLFARVGGRPDIKVF